jgi:parvulin-like peptidyl-prolyl isomerase
MSFPHRLIALLAALVLALALAACGGGSEEDSSSEVPDDAVVLVGDMEVAKAEYDQLLAQARRTFKDRKQPFPKTGTQEFEQLKQAIVRSLVEEAQFAIGAEELGVEVSDEEVEKRLDELKEQYFQGDDKKYEEELKKQGVTDAQVREDLRSRILSEKIFKEVTGDVKVTEAEVKKYYEDNKEAQFGTPASREVRHILVRTRARADQLYAQLRGGASFAALAKRYSQDPSSKDQGGKFTAQKGATVAPFDRTAFALETGELSRPVRTRFGFHLIEALADVKKASSRPLASVQDEIRQTLLRDKQNQVMTEWVEDLKKRLDGDVAYAVGFKPPAAETTTTEPVTTTTG